MNTNKLKKDFKDSEEYMYTDNNKKVNKTIIDYRFFEVHNFNTPIVVFINNNHIEKKLLQLFNELEICIITTETDREMLKDYVHVDDYIEDTGDYFSNIIKGIRKSFGISRGLIDNMGKTAIQRPKPKVIIYTDDDGCISKYFFLINTLLQESADNPDIEVSVLTNDSLMTPLNKGMNILFFPKNLFTRKGVGLLPTSAKAANLSTNNFVWEVSSITYNI
jgi:hypothetical protein